MLMPACGDFDSLAPTCASIEAIAIFAIDVAYNAPSLSQEEFGISWHLVASGENQTLGAHQTAARP